MNYLLDTHILLWVLFSPDKLSAKLQEVLTNPRSTIFVSAISVWEISLKCSIGKMKLEQRLPSEIPDAVLAMNINFLNLDPYSAATFYKLPRHENKDPFDRMLAWQAISENFTLISKDKGFDDYQKEGLIRKW